MKILFDQGTPLPLRKFLSGHEVIAAYHAGWSELGNGELIAAAEAAGFEALVTTDRKLEVPTESIWQALGDCCAAFSSMARHRAPRPAHCQSHRIGLIRQLS